MTADSREPTMMLKPKWIPIAQIIWAVLVISCIALFIATMATVATDPASFHAIVVTGMGLDPLSFQAGLEEIGVTSQALTIYVLAVVTAISLSCMSLAAILVWRRFNDWMVLLLTLSYVAYGTGYIYISPAPTTNYWAPPLDVVARFLTLYCGVILYLMFWFLFPDGNFRPKWTRWIAIFVLAFGLYWVIEFDESLQFSKTTGFVGIGLVVVISIILSAIAFQVYRYMRFSSPVERQQTKWAVAGFSVALIGNVLVYMPRLLDMAWIRPSVSGIVYSVVAFSLSSVFVIFGLVALAVAVMRYRLWDIDIIIRRTLIYGTLTISLAVIFFVSVAFIQALVPARSELVTVLSTLLVAALFTPLRYRVQNEIDRRFCLEHSSVMRSI
jgi:hypothetical protein